MVTGAAITGFGSAVPAPMSQDALWADHFRAAYGGSRVAERIWHGAGVRTRHAVVDPRVEDISGWGTGDRMRRYQTEAMPLGKAAVGDALSAAGIAGSAVDLFAVVSCTGYATPGLDILLARDLGMPTHLQRLVIGHMGCYAALPGLAAVTDAVRARGLTAVLLCVELPSLHVQPGEGDIEQLVAHALFADAAAAVVVQPAAPDSPSSKALELVDIVASTDVAHHGEMTWDITDTGFRMRLSPKVPAVLRRHVRTVVTGLLARNSLSVGEVAGWAVHPGGPRILDVVAEQLELAPDALAASRAVLRDYGNCSSATVLLVLDTLIATQTVPAGAPVVALAFGPGLTLYAALLTA
ncbi:MAG TPA: 3-oxoacyl-[acyl-carrier-protein] synthase III C-terminal domain-containing protein [Mycobacteriales bacterium]|nr:3-oxoacyl-[acyl-carrier-protein] synthase III C-terminal domain-containing protein [Mycobacteriales bacterium]